MNCAPKINRTDFTNRKFVYNFYSIHFSVWHVLIRANFSEKKQGPAKISLGPKLKALTVPSGGLTLILGTQKWGFSCKVERRPPADIFLNESLPPKTPCRHHVHGRHGHGSPVNCWRFSKFRKKYETLTLTLKICILQENRFKELTLVLFESLF